MVPSQHRTISGEKVTRTGYLVPGLLLRGKEPVPPTEEGGGVTPVAALPGPLPLARALFYRMLLHLPFQSGPVAVSLCIFVLFLNPVW